MTLAWKPNWSETRRHFSDWWERKGLVLGSWGAPLAARPHEAVEFPKALPLVEGYTDAAARANREHGVLAHCAFPADVLPLARADVGPGSLALYLGCEPGFAPDTVWFEPFWHDAATPETLPPLTFDAGNRWWRITEETLRRMAALGRGKYLVGCPDLVENLDILAAIRDSQTVMTDLLERPAWVESKIEEINRAFFDVYNRIYEIIRQDDGGAAFGAFALWGPGKTAKVQCDAAAMISPAMFRRFVVPALDAQCRWLDCSMFHLDGTQCLCHLDALLEIEALDAIEWTPQAGIEQAGSPRWYDLYRRILAAGKSVQVCGAQPEEVLPLLDAIGGRGVYVIVNFRSTGEAEQLAGRVAAYR